MSPHPFDYPCPHIATPEERQRDPEYLFCNASAGHPCHWAARFDGLPDPAHHTERLEAALRAAPADSTQSRATLEADISETGLV